MAFALVGVMMIRTLSLILVIGSAAGCGSVTEKVAADAGDEADARLVVTPAVDAAGQADAPLDLPPDATPTGEMSFFVASVGTGAQGGNLDGLAGADARCRSLAWDVNAGDRTWRAYLSTFAEDARDRIGDGPWYNANGTLVATDVENLHEAQIPNDLALTEYGDIVPDGEHDILTGSDSEGRIDPLGATCQEWTSNDENDWAAVGHVDWDPGDSWNAAHLSQCHQAGLQATAGAGRIYCFAVD